ncbi:MAG: ParB N-terminal domain-containing protein [Devosia sp.]
MPRDLEVLSVPEALKHFRERRLANPAIEAPTSIPIDSVALCSMVFQQRLGYDPKHVKELAKGLRDNTKLDPVTVWWSGDEWVIIDGHHRIMAYESRTYTGRVPVSVFEGDPEDALLESARLNSHDKLPMTGPEKYATAIRFCLWTDKTVPETARAAGISPRGVDNIRKAIGALRNRGVPDHDLACLSWRELRQMAEDDTHEPRSFDEYTEAKAQQLGDAIRPVLNFGNLLGDAEAFALAVSRLPPRFVERAMQSHHWPVDWGEPSETESDHEDAEY